MVVSFNDCSLFPFVVWFISDNELDEADNVWLSVCSVVWVPDWVDDWFPVWVVDWLDVPFVWLTVVRYPLSSEACETPSDRDDTFPFWVSVDSTSLVDDWVFVDSLFKVNETSLFKDEELSLVVLAVEFPDVVVSLPPVIVCSCVVDSFKF